MKAKVIRAFTCVNTRDFYALGSTYEADSERISYLATKGYVVAEQAAHIPKAEVAAPIKSESVHPFALLSHNPETAPIPKPKKKRNEHK